MTDVIRIDPDDLSLGEVESIEEILGQPFSQVFVNGGVSAKAAVALVYVVKRRDDPAFTLDDARSLKIGSLDFGQAADPTNGGGPTNSPPSATSGA